MQKRFSFLIPFIFLVAAAVLCLAASLSPASPSPPAAGTEEPKTFASEEELAGYIRENVLVAGEIASWENAGARAAAVPEAGAAGQAPTAGKRAAPESLAAAPQEAPAADFSPTNVQVEGVDEGDCVKTDGRYIYIISGGGGTVTVVEARPAGEVKTVSEISVADRPSGEGTPEGSGGAPWPRYAFAREIYVRGDTLAVLGSQTDYRTGGLPETFLAVYDVSSKENPVLKKDVAVTGDLIASRLIGDCLYAVVSAPVTWLQNTPGAAAGKEGVAVPPAVPASRPLLPRVAVDGAAQTVLPGEIYYFPYPDRAYCYTTVISLNLRAAKDAQPQRKTFLTGASQNIYASAQNIYLTGAKTPDLRALGSKYIASLAALAPPQIRPKIEEINNSPEAITEKISKIQALLEDCLFSLNEEEAGALAEKISAAFAAWQRELALERDKTIVRKLALNDGEISYFGTGEVPGTVLNQFSMDEYQGYFRVATTTRSTFFPAAPPAPRNNVYVLDEKLQVAGSLQGLAPGETIYAARFAGDRAYLVTFRQTDPLFVLDLKDPRQPKMLGELKIPGYSAYLHPVDENHLLGIGREVGDGIRPLPQPAPAEPRPLIWPPPPVDQGIKVALFDVSNPEKPVEEAKYVIPGANAWSPALSDHKAVLFSRPRGLLVIPVTLGPIYRIMSGARAVPPFPETGDAVPEKMPSFLPWQGFYVFNVTPESGLKLSLKLKGTITHAPAAGYPPDAPDKQAGQAKRALFIEGTLYTLSDRLLKANRLADLRETGSVWLK
jgi:uncharacterized secreted protein with C-terminal beta-propeller domain